MSWTLDNDRPIYLQLMERIQRDIIAGVYQPGDKLPSVRDLALEAAVNPTQCRKHCQSSNAAVLCTHSGQAGDLSQKIQRC